MVKNNNLQKISTNLDNKEYRKKGAKKYVNVKET